jgi:hypothetical protein
VGSRRQVEGALGFAYRLSGIEHASERAAGPQRALFDTRVRQEHGKEVDDAAQQGEGKQDEQPVQLLALAYRVDGEEQGDGEVKSESDKGHDGSWRLL